MVNVKTTLADWFHETEVVSVKSFARFGKEIKR